MSNAQNPCSQLTRILLVEDDLTDVKLFKRIFKQGCFENELHVVNDGVEALDFLRGKGRFVDAPRPDLVLLDLNMPRKDGSEVLDEIKSDENLMSIPVVVVSTSALDRDARPATAKADCYITKPVTPDHFEWLAGLQCADE